MAYRRWSASAAGRRRRAERCGRGAFRRRPLAPAYSPRIVRRLQPEARRAELLVAAGRLVAAGGVDDLALERVAEVAGCSRNLVYSYFANRDTLLDALVAREREEFLRRVVEEVPFDADVPRWLAGWSKVLLDAAEERGELLVVMMNHDRAPMAKAEEANVIAGIVAARLQQEQGLDAGRAAVVARILLGTMAGAIGAVVRGGLPRPAVEAELRRTVGCLLGD